METLNVALLKGKRIKGVKKYVFETEEEMNGPKAAEIFEDFLCDWVILQISMGTGINQVDDETVSVTVGGHELNLYLNTYTHQILATVVHMCTKNAVKLHLNYKTADGWETQSF